VADRIALLLGGAVEQVGAPRDFYTAPATLNVACFFGWQVIERGEQMIAFRPERARLRALNGGPPTGEELIGRLVAVRDLGARARCRVALRDGTFVEVEQESCAQTNGLRPGEWALIELHAGAAIAFMRDEGISRVRSLRQ
jgi:ABC-type proline/glycine betaine transport system ATPase subunit